MKKILLLSAFVAASGLVFAGNNPFKTREAKNSTFYVPHSDITDCAIHIESLISDTLFLAYERIGLSLPAGWAASLCDNANCYGDVHAAGNMAPFKSPAEAFIKITVAPQGIAGTAVIQYVVWNLKAPTEKDTLTLNIVVNWGANLDRATTALDAVVYPNLAPESVQVMNPLNLPLEAVLMTLDGRQIGEALMLQPTEKRAFPLQGLPAGIYLVELKSADHRKTFRVMHP